MADFFTLLAVASIGASVGYCAGALFLSPRIQRLEIYNQALKQELLARDKVEAHKRAAVSPNLPGIFVVPTQLGGPYAHRYDEVPNEVVQSYEYANPRGRGVVRRDNRGRFTKRG